MKVYLVGMPGSGKSTLGKLTAESLGIPFVDLDKEIEKKMGCSIPEIFSSKGEDFFRLAESEILLEWASRPDSFIMATGGGTPCFHNGMDILNGSGFTIFLELPLQDLVRRLSKNSDRPLLANQSTDELINKLTALNETRTPVYKMAKMTLFRPTLSKLLKCVNLESKA